MYSVFIPIGYPWKNKYAFLSEYPVLFPHPWVLSCFSLVRFFATIWIVTHNPSPQPKLSMGFSSQEYWSGLPCPLPGDLPNPGIEPMSSALQADSLLSHQGSPRILDWVAYPFSRGSSWPRNCTGVSCITGRFFTSWATREKWTYNLYKIEKTQNTAYISPWIPLILPALCSRPSVISQKLL